MWNLNGQRDVLIKNNYVKYIILAVLLVCFFIHASQYINKDFWHDEAFQYLYSENDWSYILSPNDVHPPLFNLLAKLMVMDTLDIKSLRAKILLFGLLFIISFYYIISKIFNNDISFYSTALLVMSPTYAYYSIEFRSYMFVLLFMIWQIYYFWKYQKTMKFLYLVIALLISYICVWTHYYSILILFAELIWLLFFCKINTDDFMFVVGMSFLSFPALFFYIIYQMQKISSFWFKDIDFISLISTPAYIIAPPLDILSLFQFAVLILAFVGLFWGCYKKDKNIIYFTFILLIPIISVWIFSQFFAFYHHRYFIFGGIGLFVGGGYIIDKINKIMNDLSIFVIFIIFALFITILPVYTDNINTELRDSAFFMMDKPDLPIIHDSTFSQSPYKVYLPNRIHYLLTNLTREQLFTAGGSVVKDAEILRNITDYKGSYYLISANIYQGNNKIYENGGLYIYEK